MIAKILLNRTVRWQHQVAKTVALLCLCFGASLAQAATWTGNGADSNWSTGGNWSTGVAPLTSETATFDGAGANGNKACTVNVNITVRGIDIQAGYTNTIDASVVSVDVNGIFRQADGSFRAPGAGLSMRLADDLIVSGGLFIHNSGTVTLDSNPAHTLQNGTSTFNNLTINFSDTRTDITVNGTVQVDGDLTVTQVDKINAGSAPGQIRVLGNVVTTDSVAGGSAEVVLAGPAAQTINAGGQNGDICGLRIEAGASVVVTGNLGVQAFTQTGGTFTAPGGQMNMARTVNIAGGTFNHGNGTILMDENLNRSITIGAEKLNNLIIQTSDTRTDFTINGTVLVEGDFTITQIDSLGGGAAPATIKVVGNVIATDTAVRGSATVLMEGPGAQSINAAGQSGDIPSLKIAAGADVTCLGTIGVQLFTQTGGTFTAPPSGKQINIGGTVNISGGTFNHNNGLIHLDGNANRSVTVTVVTARFNDLSIQTSDSRTDFTINGTVNVDGDFTIRQIDRLNAGTAPATFIVQGDVVTTDNAVGGAATVLMAGPGTQSINAGGESGDICSLKIDTGADVTVSGTLGVQTFTQDGGIFLAPGAGLELRVGRSLNITGGTFTHNDGLIVLNDNSNRTINIGTTHINSLRFNTSDSRNDVVVSGTANLDGNLIFSQVDDVTTGILKVAGNLVSTDPSVDGSARIELNGTGLQQIDTAGGDLPDGLISVNKDSGVAVLISNMTSALDVASQDLTVTKGELDISGFNLSVPDRLTVDANGIFRLEGGETVLRVALTLVAGSIVIYDGSGSYLTDLEMGNAYSNLNFDGTGTWEPAGAVLVTGALSITNATGVFDVDGNDLQVSGLVSSVGTLRLQGSERLTLSLGNDTDSGTIEYDGNGDGNPDTFVIKDITYFNLNVNFTDANDTLATSGVIPNSLTSGLVAYWPFDEGSGTTAADVTGNGHGGNLTTMEAGDWQPGSPAIQFSNPGSLDFNDSNDKILLPSQAPLSGDWSISVWIKTPLPTTGTWHTLTRGFSTDHQVIVQTDTDLGVYKNSDGNFRDSGFNMPSLSAGWHHLVALGQGTTTSFVIDGAPVGTSDRKSTASIYSLGNYQSNGQYWGQLDDFRVYGRVISSSEINSLAQGTNTNGSVVNIDPLIVNGSLLVGGGIFPAPTTVNVAVDFNQSGGVFTAPSTQLTVGSAFSHTGGTFNHNNSIVLLNGTDQAINGSTTFNNLTKNVSSAATLTVQAGTTQTVLGALTLNGSSGAMLALRSSSFGNQWTVTPQGARAVTFVDVQDSLNTVLPSINPPNGIESGNTLNWFNPPVAMADVFSMLSDTTLTVAAPGLLGNDTDVNNDPITAALFLGPLNGTLTLNSDGSFTYTSNPGFIGTDTFTYVANDGKQDSNVATVTLTVLPPLDPVPNAAPTVFALDESTFLSSNPTGGSGTYVSWTWSGPDGFTSTLQNPGAVTPKTDGLVAYTVTVTDSLGFTGTSLVNVSVIESALRPNPSVDPELVPLGDSTSLSSNPTGGTGIYIAYNWTGPDGFTSTLQNPGTYTPNRPGSFTFTLTVTDISGLVETETVPLLVGLPLSSVVIDKGGVKYKVHANASGTSNPQPKDKIKLAVKGLDLFPGDRVAFQINGIAIGDLANGDGLTLDSKGRATGQLGSAPNIWHKAKLKYKAKKRTLRFLATKGDAQTQGRPMVMSQSGVSPPVLVVILVDRAPADGIIDVAAILPVSFKVKVKVSAQGVSVESGRHLRKRR